MRRYFLLILVLAVSAVAFARSAQPSNNELSPALQQQIDRAIQREHELMTSLRGFSPLAETYLQELRADKDLGLVPERDHYFMAQLDLHKGLSEQSFLHKPGTFSRIAGMFNVSRVDLDSLGVMVQPLVPDATGFDRNHYDFTFVRREFLGDVRTLVFDVAPKSNAGRGRFIGRIWVEDIDSHIVRFNGTFTKAPMFTAYLHFDSWRTLAKGNMWLPSYIYIEESDLKTGMGHTHIKGQTTLWGYGLQQQQRSGELTDVVVDSSVQDRSEQARDFAPVERSRTWQREAEDNVLDRLQRVGLIAPSGDVNKVLETVVNNLEVTNNINVVPEVRARVLMTSQLESFTIGHTIVLSRGLIDVLPDEATLAVMLAHELAHIALGHELDTKYAFGDRMLFSDAQAFQKFQLGRDQKEEDEADVKAMELLKASPYADKLTNAGLFLRALASEAPELTALITPHYGNRLVRGRELSRMAELMQKAPNLQRRDVRQVAALPLGSRVKLDVWDGHIEMMKSAQVPLLSAREKMPFEVTPVIQNLTRHLDTRQDAKVGAPAEATGVSR